MGVLFEVGERASDVEQFVVMKSFVDCRSEKHPTVRVHKDLSGRQFGSIRFGNGDGEVPLLEGRGEVHAL